MIMMTIMMATTTTSNKWTRNKKNENENFIYAQVFFMDWIEKILKILKIKKSKKNSNPNITKTNENMNDWLIDSKMICHIATRFFQSIDWSTKQTLLNIIIYLFIWLWSIALIFLLLLSLLLPLTFYCVFFCCWCVRNTKQCTKSKYNNNKWLLGGFF